jgi:FAD/FMN-containing dehydrogenase
MSDLILAKTDKLQGVQIDYERGIARVGSGSKWADVVPPASRLGLAALHGSTPDVSVAGYSLGGGVGWYARKLGLSANSVTAIELVTADGRLRRVDRDHDPELFWALRGGGGNFGIVTTLEIQLYAIPEVYAGVLFFPWERSSEVLHAWLEWTATVPDEVTSVGRILQFPPIDEVPEPMRGRNFVVVEAVVLGGEEFAATQIEPLRELGAELDTFATVPPEGIAELHMDPPDPCPYVGEGMMLGDLDGDAIDRFVSVAGPGSGSPLVSAEIRHLGGALSRPKPHHGVLATLDASYLTFGVGMVFDDAGYQANLRQLGRLASAFGPCDTGRQYLNFAERPTDPARFYAPHAYRRLRTVKGTYDPENVFRANHPIPPA